MARYMPELRKNYGTARKEKIPLKLIKLTAAQIRKLRKEGERRRRLYGPTLAKLAHEFCDGTRFPDKETSKAILKNLMRQHPGEIPYLGYGKVAVVDPAIHLQACMRFSLAYTFYEMAAGVENKTDLERAIQDIKDQKLNLHAWTLQTRESERKLLSWRKPGAPKKLSFETRKNFASIVLTLRNNGMTLPYSIECGRKYIAKQEGKKISKRTAYRICSDFGVSHLRTTTPPL